MQWSDVTTAPGHRTLRQFAGLWLMFFVGVATWRAWDGQVGVVTDSVAVLGVGVGALGL